LRFHSHDNLILRMKDYGIPPQVHGSLTGSPCPAKLIIEYLRVQFSLLLSKLWTLILIYSWRRFGSNGIWVVTCFTIIPNIEQMAQVTLWSHLENHIHNQETVNHCAGFNFSMHLCYKPTGGLLTTKQLKNIRITKKQESSQIMTFSSAELTAGLRISSLPASALIFILNIPKTR